MGVARRFALDLVRANRAKGGVRTRRHMASLNPDFILKVLGF
jgi:hypothetical protein